MKDITNIIKEANSTEVIWSVELFYSILEELKSNGFEISFWEGEENWATILLGEDTIAYVWNKYPLVLISSKSLENFKQIQTKYNFIYFIEVSSLHNKELKIDAGQLNAEFNTESFSAEDLWFHTNT